MGTKQKLRKFVYDTFICYDSTEGQQEHLTIKDDDSFLDNGIVDSMAILEIVYFLETEFKINVEDNDLIPENFDTINQLEMFIDRKNANLIK